MWPLASLKISKTSLLGEVFTWPPADIIFFLLSLSGFLSKFLKLHKTHLCKEHFILLPQWYDSFALGFPKCFIPMEIVFYPTKLTNVGLSDSLSIILNNPPLRLMELSNSLPLIEARPFVRHLRILLTWLSLRHGSDTMLGITTLHNGMILSTLSISSLCFELLQKASSQWR